MRLAFRPLLVAASLCVLAGCPAHQHEAPQFDTGTAAHDAAIAASDAGRDAAEERDAGMDAAAGDDAGIDGSADLDGGSDGGHDAGPDAAAMADAGHDAGAHDAASHDAGPVTCASAGGSCVGLSPSSCPAPGVVGDARHYACGTGTGLECCLPGAASSAPVCMFAGVSGQEGWYQADGTLLCHIGCAGLTAMCQRIGTSSQGWYTTSGHGCPPLSQEIVHDETCM